jgi:AraC-like DNA-binding protein
VYKNALIVKCGDFLSPVFAMTEAVCEKRFSDPDAAAAAIRSTNIEFSLLARSSGDWCVGEASLAEASLWWGSLGATSAAIGTMRTDTSWLVMSGDDARDWSINRLGLGEREMGFLPAGAEYGCSYPHPGGWFAFSCPRDWLECQARILLPEDFDFGKGISTLDLKGESTRARRAFSVAAHFATRHHDHLECAQARRALQKNLVTELLGAIEPEPARQVRRDARLFSEVLEYLNAHRNEPVYQLDLCRTLRTSRRALRRLFPEIFGTTPGKYLRLRRLQLARRALLAGSFPSVTAVAVHHGFFDLGRFASSYRALFGELPSHSLQASGKTSPS